jgi:hypothetical protein
MLRLYAHDTAAWRALPHSDGLHALEKKVQETAKLHNACVCVDESLVVCEPYSIVYVYVSSTLSSQREHVMCEEHDVYFAPVRGGLLVRTTNALYEHRGAHEQPVTSVYAKPGLRRCEQARARQFKAVAKPFRVRIFRSACAAMSCAFNSAVERACTLVVCLACPHFRSCVPAQLLTMHAR